MPKHKFGIVGAALAAVLFIGGCSGQPLSTREKGTGVGALLGAGSTGVIIIRPLQLDCSRVTDADTKAANDARSVQYPAH